MDRSTEAASSELATLRSRVSELEAQLVRHREAETALRESEELHRATLQNISDAVFVADDSGRLTFICPNVAVIFGWSYEQVAALGDIRELLGPDLFDPARLAAGGEIRNIEREIRDAAGDRHFLIVNVKRVSIQDGTVLYSCRDISERKQVANELRDSEARLREAQQLAKLGFWDWDIASDELFWSDEIFRIFGLGRDDFGATYDAFLASVHADDREFVRRSVDAALYEEAEYNLDHRIRLPDGETRHVHELAEVTRDDDGTPLRMVGTVIDITRRKRAEEARRRAEERARLSEGLASLGTLTAGIAHDVGTPVNVILGYARMMTSSLQDEKNRERAALIAEQAQRVANLIQTLLNVARPGERIHGPVQLAGVLDAALSFVQERLSGHGIELERRLAAVPDVRGDPDRLQQVFLNLFLNASDAMPEGGALRVELSTSGDAHVEIAVEDSGPGIPAEMLARIFEPFFTTKPRGKGCGLGLLMSRRILIEHGGTIDVTSEVGRGTRFRIRLPVGTAGQEAERNKRAS